MHEEKTIEQKGTSSKLSKTCLSFDDIFESPEFAKNFSCTISVTTKVLNVSISVTTKVLNIFWLLETDVKKGLKVKKENKGKDS
jgi:hypothetical protein